MMSGERRGRGQEHEQQQFRSHKSDFCDALQALESEWF